MKQPNLREETKERIIKQLESMSFEEARNKILLGELGYDLNSLSHNFCLNWLLHKESQIRDDRERAFLSKASSQIRWARLAAILATIAAIIATQDQIFKLIKLIIDSIN